MKTTVQLRDRLDERLLTWKREIPNLDIPTEGIVERIQGLSRYFERSMDETLAEFDLDQRAYWLIGHLRYFGPPYRRSAGELSDDLHLSSGAMTARAVTSRMVSAGPMGILQVGMPGCIGCGHLR